ncbi:uncharacterized protein LOC121726069 [Aricia agestis]|uniref:uncharacterized protein LOC121726069 n=1 Tax=Aricia agestis TaxID=91739 RepID=UPI001C20B433|nr:uncharacterized protein LOC121726069 [Aricia agestis]
MGIDLHLTENDTDVISNVDASYTIVNSPTPNTLDQISESDLPRTPSPLSCILSSPFRHAASPQSSIVSSPSTHISSPKISCPRPAKKKSPWKHILRKFQYRYNKELKLKDQKIQELKRINQNCLKRIQRLQRDKIIRDLNKKNHNLSIIEQKSQLPIEPCHAEVKNIVKKYFEDDENSRMCAGKKEFVTKGKIKKQKKYLTDSLLNLHNKYIKNYPQYKLSYSAFCKLRPFWIRIPNVNSRETCLCKDHENMDLVVLALRQNNLIVEKSVNEVLQTLCCDPRNINCLAKNCDSCKHKVINYKEFDNSKEAYYWIWNKVKKTYIKDQKEKTTLQTIKEKKPQGEKKKVKKELVAHDMTSPSTSEDVKKRHREVRHNLFDDDSENLAPSEKPKKYFF